MIGTATDYIISGYDFPKFAVGDRSAEKTVGGFQAEAAAALVALKKEQRTSKTNLELAKNQMMDSNAEEQAKHDYLFYEYVPALRGIGISLQKALDCLAPALRKVIVAFGRDRVRSAETAANCWSIQVRASSTSTKWFTVLQLFKGDAGYEIVPETGTARPVWRKKLSTLGKTEFASASNEYVRDDRGAFTRRYAYAAKSLPDAAKLYKKEALTGRWQGTGKGTLSLDESLKQKFPALSGQNSLTREQMMYIHQELGSGIQQRGICLSSTNKRLHGNRGGAFFNEGSIIIKVDLARVPEGGSNLFNLYSQEAQTFTIGLDTSRSVDGRLEQYSADQSKQHTDTSTAKNRELYLSELRWEYVANPDEVERELLETKQITLTKPDKDGFQTITRGRKRDTKVPK